VRCPEINVEAKAEESEPFEVGDAGRHRFFTLKISVVMTAPMKIPTRTAA
jgi:hypothetical protein